MSADQTPPGLPAGGDAPDREERLFAAHYLPVMRLCLHRLRDVDDAEDAVQEVFRRAVQHSADLHDDPLPWLITVAKRVCLDELRRRRSALDRTAPAEATPAAADCNPERMIVGQLFVRELLGRLTPAERRVMAARVWSADSSADTAELLGVSSSTTRVLLARARQKLRAYLESGQAAFAGVPVLATRALYGLRRRLLERPWVGDGRLALALPAALVFTVASGPGMAVPPAVASVAPSATSGGAAPLSAAEDGSATSASPQSRVLDVSQMRPSSAGAPKSAPNQFAPTMRVVGLTPPDAHDVTPRDVEPSPNYSQDHTLFMIATDHTGNASPLPILYKSTDGGATWAPLTSLGLDSSTLILSPSTFAQNVFYAFGTVGLQKTTTGGASFMPVLPASMGYASPAPATSNLNVVLGNTALWEVDGTAPVLLSTFGNPNAEAAGPPAFIHTTAGDVILQPLAINPLVGNAPNEIVRCSPQCGDPVQLPFSIGGMQIVPSPDEPIDHTIFVASDMSGVAVSYDDGRTFSARPGPAIAKLAIVQGPAGRRLVALTTNTYPHPLRYSDDDGATWHTVALDPALDAGSVETLTSLTPDSLIATVDRGRGAPVVDFLCSTDGGAWTECGHP